MRTQELKHSQAKPFKMTFFILYKLKPMVDLSGQKVLLFRRLDDYLFSSQVLGPAGFGERGRAFFACPLFCIFPPAVINSDPVSNIWLFQAGRQTLYTFFSVQSLSLNLGGSGGLDQASVDARLSCSLMSLV